MKLIIDTNEQTLKYGEDGEHNAPLYSKEAFEQLSELWLKVGWNQAYSYTFSWMGRPIIQLPEDIIRIQEVIWRIQPDVIVETGVAHGGSLIFYASLCKAMEKGRIVGVDIEIRPQNRSAIESHDLSDLITLIEGDSTAADTVSKVRGLISEGETVLVLLDSCHTKQHVANELEAYAPLVTSGSYIVATDGIMKWLADVPRGDREWSWDNPTDAAAEFATRHNEFILEQPAWPFNQSELTQNLTYWPGAWLRRK